LLFIAVVDHLRCQAPPSLWHVLAVQVGVAPSVKPTPAARAMVGDEVSTVPLMCDDDGDVVWQTTQPLASSVLL
jgi:hypothetical protein